MAAKAELVFTVIRSDCRRTAAVRFRLSKATTSARATVPRTSGDPRLDLKTADGSDVSPVAMVVMAYPKVTAKAWCSGHP